VVFVLGSEALIFAIASTATDPALLRLYCENYFILPKALEWDKSF
jgi:hypothetical protein